MKTRFLSGLRAKPSFSPLFCGIIASAAAGGDVQAGSTSLGVMEITVLGKYRARLAVAEFAS